MPRRPSSTSFTLSIEESFDETKNYEVKLFELEERESQYVDQRKKKSADPQMAMIWKMNVYNDDGVAFLDTQTDAPFELWAWTSDSTFANEKTGKKSRGREFTEAFMGGELSDPEVDKMIDEGFEDALVGKTALASFEITTNSDGNERLNVIKLRPSKSKRASRRRNDDD